MRIEDKDTNTSLNIEDDGSIKSKVIDDDGNIIGATSNALDVNIKSGGGTGGTAAADDADFTAGTTPGTPVMGVYQSGGSTVTDGDLGTVGIDVDRNLKVNVVAGGAGGGEVTQGTAGNLLTTVSCGTSSSMMVQAVVTSATAAYVISGTASNLKAEVTQAGTVTVHSGTVGSVLVRSGTAGNMVVQAVVTSATAAFVQQGTAANLKATVTQAATVIVHSGTAGSVLVRSGTAANLKAEVVLVASTVTVGHAVVHNELGTYFAGTATVAPTYAAVSFSSTGDNTVIAGSASKKIYVLSGVIMSSTVTNMQWWNVSTAGTVASGVMAVPAAGGYQIPWTPVGAIATNQTGVALILNLSAASTVGGFITYVVV